MGRGCPRSPTRRSPRITWRPEIDALNRIVTAYLDFAELQALSRRPMYMADWIDNLDDFLRLSDRDILTHAGKISARRGALEGRG